MPMYDIQPVEPRLPERGRIRLGMKRENGAPMDVHFFVLRDAPLLIPAYGEQPTKLLIFFALDELDRNIIGWHEKYAGPACVCRGDGRKVKDRIAASGRVIRDYQILKPYAEDDGQSYAPGVGAAVHCPGLNHIYPRCQGCSPTTRLMFLVRDPRQPMEVLNLDLAIYHIVTRSFHNQQLLMGQALSYVKMAERARRGLAGIPFILERRPAKITITGEDGRPKVVTKHLLNLFVDWPALLSEKRDVYLALDSAREDVPQLPASVDMTGEEDIPTIDVEGEILDPDDEVEPEDVWSLRDAQPRKDVTPAQIAVIPPAQIAPVFKRPYTPSQFKAQYQAALPGYQKKYPDPVPEALPGLLARKLNAMFQGEADKQRHTVLRVVNGRDSVKALSHAEIKLWLDILIDGAAISEVNAIVREDAKDKGQMALEL